jgi:hypothetical protein
MIVPADTPPDGETHLLTRRSGKADPTAGKRLIVLFVSCSAANLGFPRWGL